jgi:hypothetical protein
LDLENDLSYQVGNDLEVLIRNSSESNRLDVILKVISKNKESAVIRAENELERISNLISWFHNTPIIKWKISGITFSEKKGSRNIVVTPETLTLSARLLCIKKTLGNESIKQLTKIYNSDFEEILIMWRQALVEESKGLKFFHFYRILEKLCGDISKVEEFIKGKISTVEMRDNGRGNKVTIFTFLRHNIHPKSSKFPYNEIEQHLPQLQDLVREKIKENFSSDLST